MRHIIALSGGKDSTALALRLSEVEPENYLYVITPTGDELPEMFEHWHKLSVLLNAPLISSVDFTKQPHLKNSHMIVCSSGSSLRGLIRKQRMLPNHRARWCTRMLKIEPYKQFLCTVAPAVSHVGLRADEPERIGGLYSEISGITQRYPLREWGWGIKEVLQYLDVRGLDIPKRTDCARCFFQRIGEWWLLWKDHPDIYQSAIEDEESTGHTFRNANRDSWPASLTELRNKFESGSIPRGSAQLNLFDRKDMCRTCSM